jgi:trk system potassium uptake protein TrkA
VHVVIVGCGRVGSTLAKNLTADGNTVSIIDRRASAFERLGPSYTGQTVLGIGFDRDRLTEAGIERADAVAAVTSGDNSNILIARVARETFGIERVVARIYDPRRAAIYQRLGITTVATALWTVERVQRRIVNSGPAVEWVDPSARVSLVECELGRGWVGHRVSEVDRSDVRVMAVRRMGESMLATSELVVQEGDVMYLAVAASLLPNLEQVTSAPSAASRH